eukprot:7077639-Prymnesium_polylepis.1
MWVGWCCATVACARCERSVATCSRSRTGRLRLPHTREQFTMHEDEGEAQEDDPAKGRQSTGGAVGAPVALRGGRRRFCLQSDHDKCVGAVTKGEEA